MFTTAKQATRSALQQAAALALAAFVTFSLLYSIDLLASAPSPDSLMAAGPAHVAPIKGAANG